MGDAGVHDVSRFDFEDIPTPGTPNHNDATDTSQRQVKIMADSDRRQALEILLSLGATSLAGCTQFLGGDNNPSPIDTATSTDTDTPPDTATETPTEVSDNRLSPPYEVVSVPGKDDGIRSVLEEDIFRYIKPDIEEAIDAFGQGIVITQSPVLNQEEPNPDEGIYSETVDLLAMRLADEHEFEILSYENPWMTTFVQALGDKNLAQTAKKEAPVTPYPNSFKDGYGPGGEYVKSEFENAPNSLQASIWAQDLLFNMRGSDAGPNSSEAPLYAPSIETGIERKTDEEFDIEVSAYEMQHNVNSSADTNHNILFNYLADLDEIHLFDTVAARHGDVKAHAPIGQSSYADPQHQASQMHLLPTIIGKLNESGGEITNLPGWIDKIDAKNHAAGLLGNMTSNASVSTLFADPFKSNVALADDITSTMMWGIDTYNRNELDYRENIIPVADALNSYRNKDGQYSVFLDDSYDGPGIGLDFVEVISRTGLDRVWRGEVQSKEELLN